MSLVPEEAGIWLTGTEVWEYYELPCGYQEPNLEPLQEQFLNTEPALLVFKFIQKFLLRARPLQDFP